MSNRSLSPLTCGSWIAAVTTWSWGSRRPHVASCSSCPSSPSIILPNTHWNTHRSSVRLIPGDNHLCNTVALNLCLMPIWHHVEIRIQVWLKILRWSIGQIDYISISRKHRQVVRPRNSVGGDGMRMFKSTDSIQLGVICWEISF